MSVRVFIFFPDIVEQLMPSNDIMLFFFVFVFLTIPVTFATTKFFFRVFKCLIYDVKYILVSYSYLLSIYLARAWLVKNITVGVNSFAKKFLVTHRVNKYELLGEDYAHNPSVSYAPLAIYVAKYHLII